MDQTAGKASSQYGGGSSGGGGWEGSVCVCVRVCVCVCVCHSEPSLTFTGPETGERERGWWGVSWRLIVRVCQSCAPIYALGLAAGRACIMNLCPLASLKDRTASGSCADTISM